MRLGEALTELMLSPQHAFTAVHRQEMCLLLPGAPCLLAISGCPACLPPADKEGEFPALRERMKEIGVILHKLLANSDSKVGLLSVSFVSPCQCVPFAYSTAAFLQNG